MVTGCNMATAQRGAPQAGVRPFPRHPPPFWASRLWCGPCAAAHSAPLRPSDTSAEECCVQTQASRWSKQTPIPDWFQPPKHKNGRTPSLVDCPESLARGWQWCGRRLRLQRAAKANTTNVTTLSPATSTRAHRTNCLASGHHHEEHRFVNNRRGAHIRRGPVLGRCSRR